MERLGTILLYAFLLFAMGCGAKKKVSETISKEKDSVLTKVEVIQRPPILTEMVISSLCDSIENKPVQFKKIFVIDKDTLFVNTVDNQLLFRYQVSQSVISKLKEDVKYLESIKSSNVEVVKYRIPLWVWLVMLGELLVILVLLKVWRYF